MNPFHITGRFVYPLKTSENFWFSDIFKGYRKRQVAWIGLKLLKLILNSYIKQISSTKDS